MRQGPVRPTYTCEASKGVDDTGPSPVAVLCGASASLHKGYGMFEVALCPGCKDRIDLRKEKS